MESLRKTLENVDDPVTFVNFIEVLRKEVGKEEPHGSTNATLDGFLDGMSAFVTSWQNRPDGETRLNALEEFVEKPSKWQAMAQLLYAGYICE